MKSREIELGHEAHYKLPGVEKLLCTVLAKDVILNAHRLCKLSKEQQSTCIIEADKEKVPIEVIILEISLKPKGGQATLLLPTSGRNVKGNDAFLRRISATFTLGRPDSTTVSDTSSMRTAQDKMDEIDVLIALKEFENAAVNIEKGGFALYFF
jgi:hypothetical protein